MKLAIRCSGLVDFFSKTLDTLSMPYCRNINFLRFGVVIAATSVISASIQPSASAADGIFAGDVIGGGADGGYGPVQVQVTITEGRISSAMALQVPNADSSIQQFSSFAVPILIAETISANSSNIQGVSGASWTSVAWRRSLVSALAKSIATPPPTPPPTPTPTPTLASPKGQATSLYADIPKCGFGAWISENPETFDLSCFSEKWDYSKSNDGFVTTSVASIGDVANPDSPDDPNYNFRDNAGSEYTWLYLSCINKKLHVGVYSGPVGIFPDSTFFSGATLVRFDSGKILKYAYTVYENNTGFELKNPIDFMKKFVSAHTKVSFKVNTINGPITPVFPKADFVSIAKKIKSSGCAI